MLVFIFIRYFCLTVYIQLRVSKFSFIPFLLLLCVLHPMTTSHYIILQMLWLILYVISNKLSWILIYLPVSVNCFIVTNVCFFIFQIPQLVIDIIISRQWELSYLGNFQILVLNETVLKLYVMISLNMAPCEIFLYVYKQLIIITCHEICLVSYCKLIYC